MLNEHHSTPFCMQGVTNVGASILARVTKKAKIVILGNILPIWDDPLWLAETLAMIDMISYGRLVSGFVRGGGRESVSHNAPPHYNRERFEEAHDFIIKTWTTPGPFRWEGKHYQYRYVNPWAKPFQQPHPQIWIPSTVSVETVKWTAQHRYPLVLLATKLEPTKQAFELYADTAAEAGYTSGTQNVSYLFKVHVDETEEKADEVGRKYLSGVSNPFLAGNEGAVNPAIMNLPGHTSRTSRRLAAAAFGPAGRFGTNRRPYEEQVNDLTIISGTPKMVLPKIRHVLEYLRPGSIFFWDGDGAMTHEDQMRSLRLMGEEILPAVRQMGEELELFGPFEVDPSSGKRFAPNATVESPVGHSADAGMPPEIPA
jgi:alkanesulfonate monooxygenase SsuD/methylene tetrahydromethanopterin reductase-like flavin-dependent oxidoreductase (luciferase family)